MNDNFNLVKDGNLGSFECTETVYNKRTYMGYSSDIDKLPKNDLIATGSVAMCLDTGDTYIYHKPSKTWNLQ